MRLIFSRIKGARPTALHQIGGARQHANGWDEARTFKADSQPAGYVHPRSLALLESEGISTEGFHSKSWDDLPVVPDIVVTVCASAAGEVCPAYIGNVLRTHWGVEDPAHVIGTDEEIDAAFMTAYRILRTRIEAFLKLPLDELKTDRAALKAELDRIGVLLPDDQTSATLQRA